MHPLLSVLRVVLRAPWHVRDGVVQVERVAEAVLGEDWVQELAAAPGALVQALLVGTLGERLTRAEDLRRQRAEMRARLRHRNPLGSQLTAKAISRRPAWGSLVSSTKGSRSGSPA